jgi:hypothetical protein
MLDHILGTAFYCATADGALQSPEDIVTHPVTVVPEVAWCLLYLVWIAGLVQVQSVERCDHLVYCTSPQSFFPLFHPLLGRCTLTIHGMRDRPQALQGVIPVDYLCGFGKVGKRRPLDPRRAVIDGTQSFYLI